MIYKPVDTWKMRGKGSLLGSPTPNKRVEEVWGGNASGGGRMKGVEGCGGKGWGTTANVSWRERPKEVRSLPEMDRAT